MLKPIHEAEVDLCAAAALLKPVQPAFTHISGLTSCSVHLELDELSPAGSVKLKPALQIMRDFRVRRIRQVPITQAAVRFRARLRSVRFV